jgi:hypothetical protein
MSSSLSSNEKGHIVTTRGSESLNEELNLLDSESDIEDDETESNYTP